MKKTLLFKPLVFEITLLEYEYNTRTIEFLLTFTTDNVKLKYSIDKMVWFEEDDYFNLINSIHNLLTNKDCKIVNITDLDGKFKMSIFSNENQFCLKVEFSQNTYDINEINFSFMIHLDNDELKSILFKLKEIDLY